MWKFVKKIPFGMDVAALKTSWFGDFYSRERTLFKRGIKRAPVE